MSSVTRPASSTSPSWTKQHNICERLSAAPECSKCCKPPISEPIKSKGRPNIPMVYLGCGQKVHRTWEAKLHIIHQRTYVKDIITLQKRHVARIEHALVHICNHHPYLHPLPSDPPGSFDACCHVRREGSTWSQLKVVTARGQTHGRAKWCVLDFPASR